MLWGVAFANIVRGVELDADHQYVGGFVALLNPFALLGGAVTALLFFVIFPVIEPHLPISQVTVPHSK